MDYSEIKAKFWLLTGVNAGSDGGFWSDSNLLSWCNQGVKDLTSASRCLESKKTILLLAGTQEYALPDNCERIIRVSHNWEKISPTMKLLLQQEEVRWDTRTGSPKYYYRDMLNTSIGLYPAPSVATSYASTSSGFGGLIAPSGGGGVIDTSEGVRAPADAFGGLLYEITANGLEVFFNSRPNEIDSDGDVPDLPQWAHPLLVYYMLFKALSAQTPLRMLDKAGLWQSLYEHGKDRLRGRANGKLPKRSGRSLRSNMPRVSRLPDVIDAS